MVSKNMLGLMGQRTEYGGLQHAAAQDMTFGGMYTILVGDPYKRLPLRRSLCDREVWVVFTDRSINSFMRT